VTVDGFSALINGHYNLYCGTGAGGLQLKDSEFISSQSDNVYLTSGCSNTRLIGDIVTTAGTSTGGTTGDPNARGVVFSSVDITVAGGSIEQSNGTGLDLTGANYVSVSDMYFNENGYYNGASAILVKNANTVSVCGNHILRSGVNSGGILPGPGVSQVLFSGSNDNVSFCGNTYQPALMSAGICGGMSQPPCWPQYVYDASSFTVLTNASFYENPESQVLGVLSPSAASVLPIAQVLPAPRSFLTGLVLANDATSPNDTDSTGVAVTPTPSGCKVDLSNNGLLGLDTGSLAASTTYFFFVVADLAPTTTGLGTATPSCIASAHLSPNLSSSYTHYGYGIWRLVGALYADGSSHIVQFRQDGDTFYLATSVTDIKTGSSPICSVGTTTGMPCPLSVPCGRTAATCGSLPQGFAVQAFGRIVGGNGALSTNQLLLSSLDQLDQTPTAFPTAPGNTNSAGTGLSAAPPVFPFHLSTDGTGNVRVRATASSVTAYEITDGWVWHRQLQ
jgi:hypothetical protein